MTKKISILAFDPAFNPTEIDDIAAVRFWVRDSLNRTREYDSREAALEAAETFEALGFVLEDEAPMPAPEPVRTEGGLVLQAVVDEDAIAAIGDLGGDRWIVSGPAGFDVYSDGNMSGPYMTLPRGLAPEIARLLVEAWDAGYERGVANGKDLFRMDVCRLLGVPVIGTPVLGAAA